jgi:hypothetical protein
MASTTPIPDYALEYRLVGPEGVASLAGVDEVGRGACAGPLVVAACVLGLEVSCRVARAVQAVRHGAVWHMTGTVGVFENLVQNWFELVLLDVRVK